MKVWTCLIVSGVASVASAQWYNGDPDLNGGTSAEFNTLVSDSYMFEDFDHAGGIITDLFGNYYMDFSPVGFMYEIRSGMSNGFGGTLHASGETDGVYSLKYNEGKDWDAFGFLSYRLSADIVDVIFAAGTYMVALSPIGEGIGRAFIQTTSGENGVGSSIDNDLNWFHSDHFGYNYQERVADGEDYSYGVNVPAPASVALLGFGSLVGSRRRR